MDARYTVQEVRGVAMGGGMFQVIDGNTGGAVGEPVYWRDDAERRAHTLNLANTLPETDGGGMPYGTYGNGF